MIVTYSGREDTLRSPQRLHQTVDLIIVFPIGEGQQFVDEGLHPVVDAWHVEKKHPLLLKNRHDQVRPRLLAVLSVMGHMIHPHFYKPFA
jgi:hypothetical protein